MADLLYQVLIVELPDSTVGVCVYRDFLAAMGGRVYFEDQGLRVSEARALAVDDPDGLLSDMVKGSLDA